MTANEEIKCENKFSCTQFRFSQTGLLSFGRERDDFAYYYGLNKGLLWCHSRLSGRGPVLAAAFLHNGRISTSVFLVFYLGGGGMHWERGLLHCPCIVTQES